MNALIEEIGEETYSTIVLHERTLIENILKLRDKTALDAAIPRSDIIAVEINSSQEELLGLLSERQVSRLPVYRDSLDDVVGTIHIKDILACLSKGKKVVIADQVRDVPIVSPALPVLDLLLQMRQTKKHMMLVVDEFGGIDGLCTIGDVIEMIVGELDDEFVTESEPQLIQKPDGTVLADARYDIESFEDEFGDILDEEERESVDTLGGLVFSIVGRIPVRGEIVTHDSGIVFEIVDADPRQIHQVRIRNLPARSEDSV